MTDSDAQALVKHYRLAITEYEKNPVGSSARGRLHEDLAGMEHLLLRHTPRGKQRGLRPRHESRLPRPQLPSVADRMTVIPESDWPVKLADPDCPRLRPYVWDILDQDGVGSCASEAITGAIMCRREFAGAPRLKLNPWFAYHTVSGGVDMGSTLQDNVAFVRDKGVCTQDVWSRSEGWQATPSREAYQDGLRHRLLEAVDVTNKAEFGTCVLLGIPVYFGYSGHAIFAVDLIDTLRFRYANSWDEGWGDQGFGSLAFEEVMWLYGAYGILGVTQPDDE